MTPFAGVALPKNKNPYSVVLHLKNHNDIGGCED